MGNQYFRPVICQSEWYDYCEENNIPPHVCIYN